MAEHLETVSIQWHLGFCSAAEIELVSNKEDLEFLREFQLSKEPLRMDLLIIKKPANVRIHNEIGHIFKRYNVVEYKSPDDGLSIDDFYKTLGYACLYKGLGETVNEIPAEELTVSIFRETYPRELLKALEKSGAMIEQHSQGIFYIKGHMLFDTQLVVTGQLAKEAHSSLRVLSKRAQKEDVQAFLAESRRLTTPGARNNIDAILQVSASANRELYEEVRRDSNMCEALRELMKDEIEKERQEAAQAAAQAAAQTAKQDTILENIKSLMHNLNWSAEQAMAALNIPVPNRSGYISRL